MQCVVKNSIAKLLPLHAARERRALRLYHEKNLVYESALAQQTATNLQHTRLKIAAQKKLANLLDVQVFGAAEAQHVLLAHAELQDAAQAVSDRMPEFSERVRASLEFLLAARQTYAQKVLTHFKMREASRRVVLQERHWVNLQAEQFADDEFATHQSTRPIGSHRA